MVLLARPLAAADSGAAPASLAGRVEWAADGSGRPTRTARPSRWEDGEATPIGADVPVEGDLRDVEFDPDGVPILVLGGAGRRGDPQPVRARVEPP